MHETENSALPETGHSVHDRGDYKKTRLLSHKDGAVEIASKKGYVSDIRHHNRLLIEHQQNHNR